jgi:hypothetical protein
MILLALLLASLGLADLVRARLPRVPATESPLWLPAAVGVVVFLLGSAGSGLDWWWPPIAVLAIAGWLATTRESSRPRRRGYWAIGGLVLVIVAAIVAGPALGSPSGVLVDWYSSLPYTALEAVSFTTFALTVGGALFLFETSNVIVRLALRGEKSEEPRPLLAAGPPRRHWWQREAPAVPVEPVAEFTELKGGRFIGPFERIFLLALVVSGQFTAIAAVIAAKGIIRFPEISKDSPGGSKAEYFLVGSFASWGLVVVVALLVLLGPTH